MFDVLNFKVIKVNKEIAQSCLFQWVEIGFRLRFPQVKKVLSPRLRFPFSLSLGNVKSLSQFSMQILFTIFAWVFLTFHRKQSWNWTIFPNFNVMTFEKMQSWIIFSHFLFYFRLLKGVLTQVTPSTKLVLNRLGVFTVSSFHAYVCARSPSLLVSLKLKRVKNSPKQVNNEKGAFWFLNFD